VVCTDWNQDAETCQGVKTERMRVSAVLRIINGNTATEITGFYTQFQGVFYG
jgi:hypothetical protein